MQCNSNRDRAVTQCYSLCYSSTDEYGKIALDCLNEWLSQNTESVCIIAGYADRMEKHFFDQNPGLRRRFQWRFQIKNYNSDDLARIFLTQVNAKGWKLAVSLEEVQELFKEHKETFKDNGGSTNKLVFCCKLAYSERRFPRRGNKTISKRDLVAGLAEFVKAGKAEGGAEAAPSYMYT